MTIIKAGTASELARYLTACAHSEPHIKRRERCDVYEGGAYSRPGCWVQCVVAGRLMYTQPSSWESNKFPKTTVLHCKICKQLSDFWYSCICMYFICNRLLPQYKYENKRGLFKYARKLLLYPARRAILALICQCKRIQHCHGVPMKIWHDMVRDWPDISDQIWSVELQAAKKFDCKTRFWLECV